MTHPLIYMMRAAYDKGDANRLEQVIEWLRSMNQHDLLHDYFVDPYLSGDDLIKDLKKAMRPQEDN